MVFSDLLLRGGESHLLQVLDVSDIAHLPELLDALLLVVEADVGKDCFRRGMSYRT